MVCKPHGTPRPTRMSNTLLPIVLDTAISPRPAKEKQISGEKKNRINTLYPEEIKEDWLALIQALLDWLEYLRQGDNFRNWKLYLTLADILFCTNSSKEGRILLLCYFSFRTSLTTESLLQNAYQEKKEELWCIGQILQIVRAHRAEIDTAGSQIQSLFKGRKKYYAFNPFLWQYPLSTL